MINCYLTFDQFKHLDRTLKDDYHSSHLFTDFFINKNIKLYFIGDNREKIVLDALYQRIFRIGIQVATNYPTIISLTEFYSLEFNLFNNNRCIIFYDNKDKNIQLSNSNGVIYIDIENLDLVKIKMKNFTDFFIFRYNDGEKLKWDKHMKEPIPISHLYYMQPFIISVPDAVNKIDDLRINNMVKEIINVFEKLINFNFKLFFESKCRIIIIFKQLKHVNKQEIIENVNKLCDAKIKKHFKVKHNIDCSVAFHEGSFETHERVMISDYFCAQAGNKFDKDNIQIDFFPIVKYFDKYVAVYEDFVYHLKSNKIRIIEP
jgi:hypothetical protein